MQNASETCHLSHFIVHQELSKHHSESPHVSMFEQICGWLLFIR